MSHQKVNSVDDGMAIDSYKIGPNIAMVLFQSRRVIGHWATVSAVTGWEQAR